MFDINKYLKKNIKQLISAGTINESTNAKVLLNQNENALGSPTIKWYNRYPDHKQLKLKKAISTVKNISTENITLTNGIYEGVDLLYRCFCNSGKDNVIICPPTTNLFERAALINEVQIKMAPLLNDFQLDLIHLENLADEHTKLIWLTSPNDPTGNSIDREDIETVLNNFSGIIIIDETYINFSRQKSFLYELEEYPNLVVLQNLDIAWGLAGLNIGITFASTQIIEVLENIRNPYSVNQLTQDTAVKALEEVGQVNEMIRELVSMRDAMKEVLEKIPFVQKVYPSDANFLLVKLIDARSVSDYLLTKGIAVSNQSPQPLCENCLRITIGTEKENTILVDALADYYAEHFKR